MIFKDERLRRLGGRSTDLRSDGMLQGVEEKRLSIFVQIMQVVCRKNFIYITVREAYDQNIIRHCDTKLVKLEDPHFICK